jgi:hypothetical protein
MYALCYRATVFFCFRLKLDRRKPAISTQVTERFVVINGFVYRSSARKLEKAQHTGATPAKGRRKTVIIKSKIQWQNLFLAV